MPPEIAIHGRKIYLLSLSKPKLESVIMINDLSSAIQYYPGFKKNQHGFKCLFFYRFIIHV